MADAVLMQAGCLTAQHIGDMIEIADAGQPDGWGDEMRIAEVWHRQGGTTVVMADDTGVEWLRTVEAMHTIRLGGGSRG